MSFAIRPAVPVDAPSLPDIERAAGESFRALPDLAWIASGDVMPVARHLELIATGTSWVAGDNRGQLLGFLSAELSGDALHIWEMSVRPAAQGQGIGRALIEAAIAFAKRRALRSLTLTTFRDVPWNAPFYTRRGFALLDAAEIDARLSSILADEIANGLPGDRRCAMRHAILAPMPPAR
jgi:GNAT superfamily N-acetyltransferase